MVPVKLFTGKRVVAALIAYFALLMTLPATSREAFMAEFWSSAVYVVGLNVLFWYAVIGAVVVFVRWLL